MPLKFNPLTAQFDLTGSGGGQSYIDGEVATYNDLPLSSTTAPLNSAWLVRSASGVWPVSRKQAGIYIRTATAGSSRDADYTYAGTMPDVFSDAVFTLYDDASTTRTGQFNLGSITAGQNRVLTWPDGNGIIQLTSAVSAQSISGNTLISSGRNRRIGLIAVSQTANVDLPYSDNQSGDILTLVGFSPFISSTLTIRVAGQMSGGVPIGYQTLATMTASGQSFTFVSDGTATGWSLRSVDTHTHAAADITSGTLSNARVNFAAPDAIGSTTPAAVSATNLSSSTRLNLPNIDGTTAGDLYRNANTLRYRDSSNTERLLLNATDNLANIASASTARTNLGVGSSDAVTFGSIQGTPIGSTTASSVAATTLSASSTVSGTGFSNYLASPPAIGGTSAAAGSFTTLSASTSLTLGTSGILSGGTNTIEQRNTTSAQTFRIYNTVSGAADANYERGFIGWSSNTLRIGAEAGGTGTARQVTLLGSGVNIEGAGTNNVSFLTNSTTRWIIGGSSGALQGSDTLPIRFGGSTSSFPRLANNGAVLRCQLADASAYAVFEALFRAQGTAPATSGATGTAGDIRYDADYIYVCTAANTWKRVAIATW